jgi:hypothetical protein
MRVKVIKKFGTHEVGKELEMHDTTARAVAKHGHIELIEGSENTQKKKGVK